jgi:hypothetical protein
MKNKSILLILFLFISLSSYSQSFGLRAGINVANLSGEIEGNSSIVAYQAGVFVDIGVGPIGDLNIALLYSKKGTKDDVDDITANIHYLELPVLLRFNIAIAFVEIGPYGSYVLSASTDGEDIKELLKSGDYGLIFGGGVNLGNIRLDARYSVGFADIDDLGINEIKNSVITLGAEFKF